MDRDLREECRSTPRFIVNMVATGLAKSPDTGNAIDGTSVKRIPVTNH